MTTYTKREARQPTPERRREQPAREQQPDRYQETAHGHLDLLNAASRHAAHCAATVQSVIDWYRIGVPSNRGVGRESVCAPHKPSRRHL